MNRDFIATKVLMKLSNNRLVRFKDIVEVATHPKRLQVWLENDIFYRLVFSIKNDGTVVLDNIELHESKRGMNLSIDTIQIFEYMAKLFSPDHWLRVRRPYNREFWKHYIEKYNSNIIKIWR